jgi:hypothetical protein
MAFTAVTMKNVVFWGVALCRCCVNRRFGGTYRLHLQGRKICERGTSVSWWLQTATSTQRHIPVDDILLLSYHKTGLFFPMHDHLISAYVQNTYTSKYKTIANVFLLSSFKIIVATSAFL